MTAIDYAALAERLKEHAALHDSLAAHSDEQRVWADDLRTLEAMVRGMAEARPVAWMALAYGLPSQATTDEPTAIRWRKAGGEVVPLYTHPAPQPQPAQPPEAKPNQNTGHGHVRPRPDGVKARCGGPAICPECAREQAQLLAAPQPGRQPVSEAFAALMAERDALARALLECDAVARARGDKYGLCDCIDNGGSPYPSQWLADLLAQAKDAEARG